MRVADHLFNPVELGNQSIFPGGEYYNQSEMPYFNSLTTLFVIAGATKSVQLGTNVLIPAYRSPVELAKQIGTLSALVGDRFFLGVGAGWLFEEFEAVGVPPEERFARLDDAMTLMKSAWANEVTDYDGRYYSHVAAGFRPVPGHVPIIVGGTGDGAVRRAAKWGDGWTIGFPKPGPDARVEAFALRDRLRRASEAAGRDPGSLRLVCSVTLDAALSSMELMIEVGVSMCDVRLGGDADLDLERFGRIVAEMRDQDGIA